MFIRSIKWRLLVWLAFLLLLLLGAFGITAFQLNRTNRLREIDQALSLRVARVSGDVRGRLPFGRPMGPPPPGFDPGLPIDDDPPGEPRFRKGRGGPPRRPLPSWPEFQQILRNIQLSPPTLALFDEPDTNSFYYAVWAPDGTLLKSSTNSPPNLPFPGPPGPDTSIQTRPRGPFREAFHFTEMGECILAGRSILSDLQALSRFAGLLVAAGAAVLALGLGGGWFIVTNSLRPIDHIGAAATRIASGNLAQRISTAETDSELGRLATVLNSTFARLENAFAQEKQFTADASHELRTPLAVMISETQTALNRQRTPEEYRDTIRVCLDTAQQMRRLTQALLTLARLDAGQEPAQRAPTDLAQRANASADLLQPLADQKQITLHLHLQPAPILADPDQLDQVILNLLSNAIQFTPAGGHITLTTGTENNLLFLTVADTGPGIPDSDLPHLFQRFYRGDKSRHRSDGHAGLGLAICKAIVQAHGGTISARTQPERGALFRVTFPAPPGTA